MMKKKNIKIISIIIICLCAIMSLSTVFADIDINTLTQGDIDIKSKSKILTVGQNIAAIIRNVGIVLAVVILMVLGVKYMMGSVSEKAEYKKTMIPYVVGAIVLFGAAAIAQAVISLSQNIT